MSLPLWKSFQGVFFVPVAPMDHSITRNLLQAIDLLLVVL
jgi:hypothetical protein